MKRRKFLILSLLGVLGACQQERQATNSSSKNGQSQLMVAVAVSLQDVMGAIATQYQTENPGVKITYNFGSSGSLAQQIEQGAPVDVFISAAEKHINPLEEKGQLVEGSKRDLLKNNIVLIVPKDNQKIKGFKSLDLAERIALGEPESVPAGQYAKEVLDFFGLYTTLKNKYIFAKDVRQVLTYVETGNIEAGIVYETDAKISQKVKVVEIAPANSHRPIIYPVGIVKNTKVLKLAQSFLSFLREESAQNIFLEYGFNPVSAQKKE